jgi:toxin ParE1/3/4
MRVVFDPLAKRELDEARDYYNQRQPGLGTEFQEAVKDSVRRLREWPESGAVELQDVRRAVLRRFPYKLLYAIQPDHVVVLAVSHQYRQPGYWLARYGSQH